MTELERYLQGRTDQTAGAVDTTRTADRAYVAGLGDARSELVDAQLQLWAASAGERPSA